MNIYIHMYIYTYTYIMLRSCNCILIIICILFLKIFFMWTIFSFYWVCYNMLPFYGLIFWLWGMWDISFLTRGQTNTPYIGRRSLNHWTTREVLVICILDMKFATIISICSQMPEYLMTAMTEDYLKQLNLN